MNSRERVRRTLLFQSPDRAPREIWVLPGINLFRREEFLSLLERFPMDIASTGSVYDRGEISNFGPIYAPGERARGTPSVVGTYFDDWGCEWHVGEPGVVGEVKGPPLADISRLKQYRPPDEIFEKGNFDKVNRIYANTDKFVLGATNVRPFERMQWLRGTEQLLMDLAWGTREFFQLRDLVHEHFLREIEIWAKADVDGIHWWDDWGKQKGLLISPKMWREIYKPLYFDYCKIIHEAGKFAFFHTDGDVTDIYPDFIELGINALNSQLFCMDIEELGKQYQGKITFWGEIDRQHILPFGTSTEVREGVRRVRHALDNGKGGVIAQCEWGNDVSSENIAAVFNAWLEE